MIVKICANTNKEDMLEADRAGADILGFVVEVSVSKRSIDRYAAINLFSIPTHADKAMLLCNHSVDETLELNETIRPYIIHLTGNEPPETVMKLKKKIRVKIFKSVHLPIKGQNEPDVDGCLDKIKSYAEAGAKFIVLDSTDPSKKLYGGTGKTNDWDAAAEIVSESALPVLLAGGLNPDNIEEAIRKVNPFGIDLVSGVEREVRIKDPQKIRLLMERARKFGHAV